MQQTASLHRERNHNKEVLKSFFSLTQECGKCRCEDGQVVFLVEPGAHGEEAEVHGGGGGEEGGAGDEHPS